MADNSNPLQRPLEGDVPLPRSILPGGGVLGNWWHRDEAADRIVCDLCPRECHLKPGDKGFCFVRENRDGQMVLNTYGKSTGFCIDPIEKKPLHHFYPGTSVLSFGTAGCNLGCKFCQNWDISKSREVAKLSAHATPETIAHAAKSMGCTSVAFTYNDPIIWAEYAIDTARACREQGIQSVAVTAGYVAPAARQAFFRWMDAANVDLKAFSEAFYQKITYSHLQPVLETLEYLQLETDVWFEITNLVIPGANDGSEELKQMCEWILKVLGPDVPVHFSAFHPDFRMQDRPPTPVETLHRAYDLARRTGLNYVFVGNTHDRQRQTTYCPKCKELLVERDWYELGRYNLRGDRCGKCDQKIAGRFPQPDRTSPSDATPPLHGTWGRKRLPIQIETFAISTPNPTREPNLSPSTPRNAAMSFADDQSNNSQEGQEPASKEKHGNEGAVEVLHFATLTDTDKSNLLKLTSRFIGATVMRHALARSVVGELLGEMASKPVIGVFVTLKRGQQLRGCCGLLGRPMPLADALLHSAHRTAKEDTRMPPISPTELPYLEMDVTILGSLELLTGTDEALMDQIEIGRHGLRLSLGEKSGLLLPAVPVEQRWSKEQFLRALSQKAGVDEDAWKNPEAKIERFEGLALEGRIDPQDIGTATPRAPFLINQNELHRLRGLVAENMGSILKGAAPTMYTPEVTDGTVTGLVLSLFDADKMQPMAHLLHLSLRPGIPLQSSLFELTKAAALYLQKTQPKRTLNLNIELTVLSDPSAHGVIHPGEKEGEFDASQVDLKGVNPSNRAVVTMMGGSRMAVAIDPTKPPETLMKQGCAALHAEGRIVSVFSMDAMSTRSQLLASSTPEGAMGVTVRDPAVAGTFYPANDHERRTQVAGFFVGTSHAPTPALAIMTPHAGLTYSGRTAAEVWKRVKIPHSVLMIGPKHTPDGVDWAVAPYRRWKLSKDMMFEADMELAHAIADHVPGMQYDARAHQREHGLEVQLPFLEELSPATKISAICMTGGSWPELQVTAKHLAKVLRGHKEMPLLVISSDMNHYAEESENKRLDRLALNAMQSGDPKLLLDTCVHYKISMCGLLPAVLVMQTLIELGHKLHVKEVSYATSADAGLGGQRVVGYAGVVISDAGH